MRVVDLAEAIAPGAPIRYIGIRPGEKVHELLITEDESRHAYDCGDCYLVIPEHPHWEMSIPDHAQPLPSNFVYSSETNEEWVDRSAVASMMGNLSTASKNGDGR
jgi:UDP-N-acetylglucosamine 4,6-dehydratase